MAVTVEDYLPESRSYRAKQVFCAYVAVLRLGAYVEHMVYLSTLVWLFVFAPMFKL